MSTDKGTRAGDCFYQSPESELQSFLQEQREKVYKSSKREPLGRGYVRGHQLPSYTTKEEFRFGVQSDSGEKAKDLIYAPHPESIDRASGNKNNTSNNNNSSNTYREEKEEEEEQAAQSLSSTARGFGRTMKQTGVHEEKLVTRPINRQYNWEKAGINPSSHAFGLPSPSIDYSGKNVAEALKQPIIEETIIVDKRVVEGRNRNHHRLGAGRLNRGKIAELEGNNEEKEGEQEAAGGRRGRTTYGRGSSYDGWGARDCLRGEYRADQLAPDRDLGVSVRKLAKYEGIPPEQRERTFGLPSIRTDRLAPSLKSIANDMNYGDESNGKGLIFPSPFANEGVNEEDFLLPRPVAEIRQIFHLIGLKMEEEEFDRCVSYAQKQYGTVSVDSVRHAVNYLRYGLSPMEKKKEREVVTAAGFAKNTTNKAQLHLQQAR